MELMNAGMRQSGVYYLQIRGTTYWFLKVYCEQEIADGGWTVRLDDRPANMNAGHEKLHSGVVIDIF